MTVLKNWSVGYDDPYIAPELQKPRLYGNVYGHPNPRHHDGKNVVTSSITEIIDCTSYKEVKTKNTTYIIYAEDVNPEYEKEYPNAYQRLAFNK